MQSLARLTILSFDWTVQRYDQEPMSTNLNQSVTQTQNTELLKIRLFRRIRMERPHLRVWMRCCGRCTKLGTEFLPGVCYLDMAESGTSSQESELPHMLPQARPVNRTLGLSGGEGGIERGAESTRFLPEVVRTTKLWCGPRFKMKRSSIAQLKMRTRYARC